MLRKNDSHLPVLAVIAKPQVFKQPTIQFSILSAHQGCLMALIYYFANGLEVVFNNEVRASSL